MASLKKLFKNRLFLAFLGVVCLSLFIWFVGPLINYQRTAPLESQYNRIIAIGSLSMFWLLTAAYRFIKARRRNSQMLDSLAETSDNEDTSAEELEILQEKMQEAVDTLKQRNFSKSGGSRFIYELPWYVIIGPPGAGKTTLLSHSGLEFPLEETHGKLSIKGVGGTRNCDWWFTDQAVLLDTAGRYTTQDSEAEVDKSAWSGFLSMLRDKRKRRPLNGVLLALSIEDILNADDTELASIAKTLRSRIDELYNQLGIAPPVYLMFTKCDLLAGFSEFFHHLNREQRQQVWGVTLELDDKDPTQTLKQEIDKLARQVAHQSVGQLQQELSQKNRENIYGFPMQFNHAQRRVGVFLEQLTSQSRLLQPVMFRGVYFTSATQTGSVLDRVIQSVSQSFGINEGISSQTSQEGRSYFIKNLLSQVIFEESGLAGTNVKTERRLQKLQWAAVAAIAAVGLSLIGLWSVSYFNNKKLLDAVDIASTELEEAAQALDPTSLDLLSVNDLLNKARSISDLQQESALEEGLSIKRAGLYQGEKIGEFGAKKYDELLLDALLPRLIVRLEHQMHAQNTNSEFLFEALKAYQMIGSREHFDADTVIGWFHFDMNTNLPADTTDSTREQLKQHIERLFKERPFRLSWPLDTALIEQYQLIAANTPLEQRAYNRIRNTAQRTLNSYLQLTRLVGPDLATAFVREDAVSLDQSIQGFYTRQGYTEVFLPASKDISRTLTDDSWVLGERFATQSTQLTPDALQENVANRYYSDYIEQWDSLFANLKIRSVDDLDQAARIIKLVADEDSPLKKFLVLANEQTTLTVLKKPSGENEEEEVRQLGDILDPNPVNTEANEDLDPVTLHYTPLHELLENVEEGSSTLDKTLRQLSELNIQLIPMSQAPAGSIDTQLSNELSVKLAELDFDRERLAEPLASMVAGLGNSLNDVVGDGVCAQINKAWKTDVFPFYQRAIRSRYPVNRKGTNDISLQDFGGFFGNGGVLDTFYNDHLVNRVERSTGSWKWVDSGSAVCLSENSLKQLAFAEDIRTTFFSAGGSTPSIQFDVTSIDNNSVDINELLLTIGNEELKFQNSNIFGTSNFTWPTSNNNSNVNLRVLPKISGALNSITLSGPWAVLRLFEQGVRSSPSGGTLLVTYSFGGRKITLSLSTSSFNPLNSVALRNFRAPESL